MVELKSKAGQEIRHLLEWQEKVAQEAQEVGVNVSSYMRDLIMSELDVPLKEAQRIADIFDEMVSSSDWVETLGGVLFKKSFDAKNSEEDTKREEHIRQDGVMVYNAHDILRTAGKAIIDIVKDDKDVGEQFLKTFAELLNIKSTHSGAKVKDIRWDSHGNIEVDFEDVPVSGKQHAKS